jgi:signal transduction histidine kinase
VKSVPFGPERAPLSARVLDQDETLIIGDARAEANWVWQPGTEQIRSWCSAPLVLGDDCIGLLCIDWPQPNFYKPEHGRVVRTFADQAAVAIGNARLFATTVELRNVLEQKVADRTSQLRDARDEVERKAHELQALLRRLVGVQEEERRRIAYDLHDSVAQSILAAAYELQALRRRVVDNEEVDTRVAQIQRLLDTTLREMKQIIYALRPTVLDELGLIPALENYLASLPTRLSLSTEIKVEGTPFPLGPDADLAVYRIVQEACQNSVRHAGASSILLLLQFVEGRLDVSIRDDGRGFTLEDADSGLGLVGIRERASAVGGDLSIQSIPGSGTNIVIGVRSGAVAH